MKKTKNFVILVLLFFFASLIAISAQHKFYVNLNDRSDDLFKVTLLPEKLTELNNTYNFAATAPGTYQVMDIGRFVRSFKAFDKNGGEIAVNNISTNQWEISNPSLVNKIYYEVAETWDTKVEENPVYAMGGSSLENDHAAINGQCVFGYFSGMQKYPVEIKLEYPNEWSVGTALKQNDNGYFTAPDFDYVVDSPILLGNLTQASTKVEETKVDIYTYSKNGVIKSENLLSLMEDVLSSTGVFVKEFPVDRYVFLFHFEDFSAGAWEHNYSSFYVYKEDPISEQFAKDLQSTAVHEFFHIITPLHIHSELVKNFNYENPVMSKHLWLYEGVTEWASDILQLRDYLISVEDFLRQIKQKLTINDNYNQSISLTELSVKATELQDQYYNIYNKGAVVAALLDIKLLELSEGKRGLRELLLELVKDYGPQKSFSEENFFDEIVERTYPEIESFIKNYISGTETLPVKDYFAKLGIDYTENVGYDSSRISLGFGIGLKDNKLVITNVENRNSSILNSGDFIYKVDDQEVTLQNAQQVFIKYASLKPGDLIEFVVKRNDVEIPVKIKTSARAIRHEFKILQDIEPKQQELRNAWKQNLSLE